MKLRVLVAVAAAATVVAGGSVGAYAAAGAGTGVGTPDSTTGPGWKAPTIVPGGSGGSVGDVLPVSANNIWATGWDKNNHVFLLHYNGSAWTKVAMPTGETHLLRLVPGSGDNTWLMTYAKDLDTGFTGEKLWQRVDGTWQQQDTYRDVYATVGEDGVWAAGQGYVERFDGTQWTKHTIPADVQVDFVHTDGTDDDVWVMGQHYTGEGESRTTGPLYALHWDGSAWNETPLPDVESPDGEPGYLRDVAGTSPDDMYAVGFWQNFNGDLTELVVLHWDGQKWSTVDAPDFTRGGDSIATSSHGGVWVTGIFAYNPTVLYRNPDNTWQKIQPSGKNPIFVNSVANIPGTDRAIAGGAVGVGTPSGLQPAIAYDK
jgi:hypothetical protein